MDVQLPGGVPPRPVGLEEDPQGGDVVGPVLGIVPNQRGQDAGHQDPGLRRGAGRQGHRLVTVVDGPLAAGGGDREGPAGLLHLVGADVVEVAPAYDHAEVTALAAATVIFDMIALLALLGRRGKG